MENSKNQNLKIPKERRKKEKDTKGELDEDGFFRTPNGSFGIVMVNILTEKDMTFTEDHIQIF